MDFAWLAGGFVASFAVYQIVFNEISAAEISALPTLEQLDLLDEFRLKEDDLQKPDGERIGRLDRGEKSWYRYRAGEWRIYFSVEEDRLMVHRVLHANTFSDFMVRSKLGSGGEDEALAKSRHFWALIEEGEKAREV